MLVVARGNLAMINYALALFLSNALLLYYQVPSPTAHFEVDSVSYQRIAQNITEHATPRDPVDPTTLPAHTLGFPAYLSIVYTLFGYNFCFVFIAHLLCMVLTFWFLYMLSLQLFDQKAAYCALFLAASNLGCIVYSNMLMPEIILITSLSAFLYFFVKFQTTNHYSSAFGAGSLLATSLLIRPAALYFIPAIIAFLIGRCSFKTMGTFLISLMIPLVCYMSMNYYLYGQAVISPLTQENLYHYYLPRLIAHQEKSLLEQAQEKLSHQSETSLKSLLFTTIYQHPLTAITVWLKNVIRTLGGLYSTQLKALLNPTIKGGACSFFKQTGNIITRMWHYITFGTTSPLIICIVLAEIIFLLIEYAAALIGIAQLWYTNRAMALFFISYISYFVLITGHDGCGRYRIMLEPVLLVLAGAGVMRLYNEWAIYLYRYSRRRQRHAAMATQSQTAS